MSSEKDTGVEENTNLLDYSSDPEVRTVPSENSFSSVSMENAPLMESDSSFKKLRVPFPSALTHGCPCGSSGSCCTPRTVAKWTMDNLLLLLTIASIIVGGIIGLSVREVNMDQHSEGYQLMVVLLGFPGEIFLRMLKMLILPLIVFSLIAGLGSLETRVAGSLGWKTVVYYGSTTILAVVLGLILVSVIVPGGRAVELKCDNSTEHGAGTNLRVVDSVLDLIRYAHATRNC